MGTHNHNEIVFSDSYANIGRPFCLRMNTFFLMSLLFTLPKIEFKVSFTRACEHTILSDKSCYQVRVPWPGWGSSPCRSISSGTGTSRSIASCRGRWWRCGRPRCPPRPCGAWTGWWCGLRVGYLLLAAHRHGNKAAAYTWVWFQILIETGGNHATGWLIFSSSSFLGGYKESNWVSKINSLVLEGKRDEFELM